MKKIFALLTITVFLFVSGETIAQQLTPQQQQAVNKLFKTNKVVYFKFKVRSLQEIPQFGKLFSVDKSEGNTVFAHADKAQFSQFIRNNISYTVIQKGTKKKTVTPAKKTTVKKK